MIIRDLPFIWRLLDQSPMGETVNGRYIPCPRPRAVPDRLNFEWDWDHGLGLLKQKATPILLRALDTIYKEGSANLGATERYGEGFWQMVQERIAIGARVLEIGPGTGWLTERMKAHGASVETFHGKFGETPLAEGEITPSYDLIVHHHVLEHVEDPVAFLTACRERLARGGTVLCAVPDCTESIALGDLSMATSQHLSYFASNSLRNAFEAAGFARVGARPSDGTLMAAATVERDIDGPFLRPPCNETFGRFVARALQNDLKMARIFEHYAGRVRIGIYCPMRMLPYCPHIGLARLFDDGMVGKYLDGVPRQIEGFADFIERPVDVMFVMSLTHEREIVEKIGGRCKVITLREMLDA